MRNRKISRRSRRGLFNHSGFTLIELVMVITILGIIAYVGIEGTFDMSSYSLDGATQKVLQDIRYAQNLAMTTGEQYGFQVTGETTYEVYKVEDHSIPTSPYTQAPMQEDLSQSFTGTTFGAAAEYPAFQVEFDAQGTPTLGAMSIILEIGEVPNLIQQTIAVSGSSGLVSIQPTVEE